MLFTGGGARAKFAFYCAGNCCRVFQTLSTAKLDVHSFLTINRRLVVAAGIQVIQSNPTACVAILDAAVRLREGWRMLAPAIRANHVPHGRWLAECVE